MPRSQCLPQNEVDIAFEFAHPDTQRQAGVSVRWHGETFDSNPGGIPFQICDGQSPAHLVFDAARGLLFPDPVMRLHQNQRLVLFVSHRVK